MWVNNFTFLKYILMTTFTASTCHWNFWRWQSHRYWQRSQERPWCFVFNGCITNTSGPPWWIIFANWWEFFSTKFEFSKSFNQKLHWNMPRLRHLNRFFIDWFDIFQNFNRTLELIYFPRLDFLKCLSLSKFTKKKLIKKHTCYSYKTFILNCLKTNPLDTHFNE